MYHLAFFNNHHLFFKTKVKKWLKTHKKYNCILIDKYGKFNYQKVNYLFEKIGYYGGESFYHHYEQNWYIHGSSTSTVDFASFPGSFVTEISQPSQISLEKVDLILDWFASSYTWSILPWSNTPRIQSFVFISRNRQLRDSFIECSSNNWSIHLEPMSRQTSNCQLLISVYDVRDKFSEATQCIVFEENINTLGEIWDICNCDRFSPYLVTHAILDHTYRQELC